MMVSFPIVMPKIKKNTCTRAKLTVRLKKGCFLLISLTSVLLILGGEVRSSSADLCTALSHPGYEGCEETNEKCPASQGLVRHVLQGACSAAAKPEENLKRKYCVTDGDCSKGSYCCLAECEGMTRCYNPYLSNFTDCESSLLEKDLPVPVPTDQVQEMESSDTSVSARSTGKAKASNLQPEELVYLDQVEVKNEGRIAKKLIYPILDFQGWAEHENPTNRVTARPIKRKPTRRTGK